MQRFQSGGAMPEDRLVLDCILVLAEVNALLQHACGEDVTELMGALGVTGKAKGEDRRVAIERVQECMSGETALRISSRS